MATPTSPPGKYPRLDHLPHVVIIGGGFAGIAAARGLANKKVRVTIIDRHNFHTFLPLLYQVATAGLEPADVAYPIRTIFGGADNVFFRHARVREVDHGRSLITLEDATQLRFDHLVVATGATAALFSIPGASRFAMPLYSLADGRRDGGRAVRAAQHHDPTRRTATRPREGPRRARRPGAAPAHGLSREGEY